MPKREPIQLTDSTLDVILKLSEGNPGAASVVVDLLKDEIRGFFDLLHLPSGETRSVEPRDGKKFTLGEAQALIGGYIETHRLNKHQQLLFDEEARLKPEVPLNREASRRFGFALLGPVLLVHRKEF